MPEIRELPRSKKLGEFVDAMRTATPDPPNGTINSHTQEFFGSSNHVQVGPDVGWKNVFSSNIAWESTLGIRPDERMYGGTAQS
ncbi:hypothetical protein EKO27_g3932 [Xylaria grammica]|uniref:Uncharacterized protein n=1 Tax=Xylaria grammica TaxID=363999 RepID=A0A439D9U2_9PEZI|nr:hypothetical protein EKO27_g3932 [Xylaria grammica]